MAEVTTSNSVDNSNIKQIDEIQLEIPMEPLPIPTIQQPKNEKEYDYSYIRRIIIFTAYCVVIIIAFCI
tara:strand:- start:151 stop:357 length:207 start_codon:yes stop_codon:yes gene_type:complete